MYLRMYLISVPIDVPTEDKKKGIYNKYKSLDVCEWSSLIIHQHYYKRPRETL